MPQPSSCNRREFLKYAALGGTILALAGCGAATATPSSPPAAAASKPAAQSAVAAAPKSLAPVRVGYQTNIWGMPLLVAIQTEAFKKQGLSVNEIQVSSGNKTRDLMVAGQADMGTFAAPALIIGAEKGELQATGIVAYVSRTIAVVAKPTITKVDDLKGKKIGMQPGASVTILGVSKVLPSFGLKKGDYEQVNVDVTNMVQGLAQGSLDAFIGVEPYNAAAVAQGIGARLLDYGKYDLLPVFLSVRPEFAKASPGSVVAILQGMLATQDLFKNDPQKAATLINDFYQKELKVDPKVIQDATSRLDVAVGFKPELKQYMQETAEDQLREKQIQKIPDWNQVLATQFLEEAEKKYKG